MSPPPALLAETELIDFDGAAKTVQVEIIKQAVFAWIAEDVSTVPPLSVVADAEIEPGEVGLELLSETCVCEMESGCRSTFSTRAPVM